MEGLEGDGDGNTGACCVFESDSRFGFGLLIEGVVFFSLDDLLVSFSLVDFFSFLDSLPPAAGGMASPLAFGFFFVSSFFVFASFCASPALPLAFWAFPSLTFRRN